MGALITAGMTVSADAFGCGVVSYLAVEAKRLRSKIDQLLQSSLAMRDEAALKSDPQQIADRLRQARSDESMASLLERYLVIVRYGHNYRELIKSMESGYVPTIRDAELAHAIKGLGFRAWNNDTGKNW